MAENVMIAKGGKGKGKKKKSPMNLSGNLTNPDIECWNCSEKGHVRSKHPKKPQRKQTSSKGKDQEVHTSQAQDNYAFSSNVVSETLSKTINEDVASQITMYNSGASAHMSPNRGRFTDFRSIEPKAVKAADKTIFLVTSARCVMIDIPNGKDNTSIMLKDMLYCPELEYTLVLLAKCDTASFMILPKDKTCCIKDPKGIQISKIPQNKGLY